MTTLAELTRDLDRVISAGDLDAVASVRRTIAEGHPGTPEAAEAEYRLGIDALFRQRDLDAAAERFRAAAKAKDATWSPRARVSLGIVLMRQGKFQQSVFELRRVASTKPPTLQSAQAAGLVVMALREAGNAKEAERARGQHRDQLDQLIRSQDAATAAYAHFMLGMEHKHDGRRDEARAHLKAAAGSGVLPPDEQRVAEMALDSV